MAAAAADAAKREARAASDLQRSPRSLTKLNFSSPISDFAPLRLSARTHESFGDIVGRSSRRLPLRPGRPEDTRGLAADEHVERLRERVMPLIEKSNRMSGDAIDALSRQREAPSTRVERSRPLEIRVVGGALES